MKTPYAIILAIVVCLALVEYSDAQGFDAQSMLGEWQGTWSMLSADVANVRGPIRMSIYKIDGSRVHAKMHSIGPRGQPIEGDVVGTLTSNGFTLNDAQFTREFTVDGNRMRGIRRGGAAEVQFDLLKK